ncbi:peroxisomal membrane protein 4 [Magnaporthiopsis poae ATCC 64411]|uniref:Peroxisomal membrane protein 4 n=1 Tax=Magnaporthiopsis poae (strain ATCC 64411 / 73-15) TaxID=644358 RepID=A0A0C4DLB8_MAGP6|nr:peroxisomal membrane protein 4 [Magnaporthiopsis poae ATCC 64411]
MATAALFDSLKSIQSSAERVILDPRYHDILAVVKGARNGAVYGTKVRFPHALVMICLFRSGTVREKIGLVYRATRTHARNLAKFATIYKLTCLLLKHYGPTPGKEGPYDTLLAGMLGGYLVFGGRSRRTGKISSVNQQIVIYVFARVVLALAPPGRQARVRTAAGLGAADVGRHKPPRLARLRRRQLGHGHAPVPLARRRAAAQPPEQHVVHLRPERRVGQPAQLFMA